MNELSKDKMNRIQSKSRDNSMMRNSSRRRMNKRKLAATSQYTNG